MLFVRRLSAATDGGLPLSQSELSFLLVLAMIWYVCHAMNGCDTGCCGYQLCTTSDGMTEDRPLATRREGARHFTFDHPSDDETPDGFARRIWNVPEGIELRAGEWWKCR